MIDYVEVSGLEMENNIIFNLNSDNTKNFVVGIDLKKEINKKNRIINPAFQY